MKHAFTQAELRKAYDAGDSILVAYRSSGSLNWSHGTQEIMITPHLRKVSGLPFTKRGRCALISPAEFDKWLNA